MTERQRLVRISANLGLPFASTRIPRGTGPEAERVLWAAEHLNSFEWMPPVYVSGERPYEMDLSMSGDPEHMHLTYAGLGDLFHVDGEIRIDDAPTYLADCPPPPWTRNGETLEAWIEREGWVEDFFSVQAWLHERR